VRQRYAQTTGAYRLYDPRVAGDLWPVWLPADHRDHLEHLRRQQRVEPHHRLEAGAFRDRPRELARGRQHSRRAHLGGVLPERQHELRAERQHLDPAVGLLLHLLLVQRDDERDEFHQRLGRLRHLAGVGHLLCQFGSELVWKLPSSEQAGRVDILPMLSWLVAHGYLPRSSGLWAIGYGWEICSTGGVNETFRVNHFSITTAAAAGSARRS